jgi:hypothetical protein
MRKVYCTEDQGFSEIQINAAKELEILDGEYSK